MTFGRFTGVPDYDANPSRERTPPGKALGPRTGQCHHPLHGPSALPVVAAQLEQQAPDLTVLVIWAQSPNVATDSLPNILVAASAEGERSARRLTMSPHAYCSRIGNGRRDLNFPPVVGATAPLL